MKTHSTCLSLSVPSWYAATATHQIGTDGVNPVPRLTAFIVDDTQTPAGAHIRDRLQCERIPYAAAWRCTKKGAGMEVYLPGSPPAQVTCDAQGRVTIRVEPPQGGKSGATIRSDALASAETYFAKLAIFDEMLLR